MRPLLTALAALTLLLAACSGDDTAADADPSDDAGPDDTGDGPADDDDTADPSDDGPDDDSDGPDPDAPLTDSYRGVTADSIKVGIGILDLSRLNRDNGDVEAKWRTAIDAVNDDGGVLGRRLEPVFATYSPIDTSSSDEACVMLAEDEEVFVMFGPHRGDAVLCYTELNDIAAINTLEVSQEQMDRSLAPLISIDALPNRLIEIGIEAMADAGTFDGVGVGVHGDNGSEDQIETAVLALEDLDVEVRSQTVSTLTGEDVAAMEAEMELYAERWRADGAEVIVAVGSGGHLQTSIGISRSGGAARMAITQPSADPDLFVQFGAELSALDGAVAVAPTTYADLFEAGDEAVVACVERFEAASGETVVIRPDVDEIANLTTTIWACQVTELFDVIATAAGPDLTNESLRRAIDELGEVAVTGVNGSLGERKYDVRDDPPVVLEWDPGAGDFVPV